MSWWGLLLAAPIMCVAQQAHVPDAGPFDKLREGYGAPGVVAGVAAIEARQTHGAVEVVVLGEGMGRVYVFVPAEPGAAGKVPFVFFAHGWQGMNPKNYGALIDHLAREGNVVVFPVYQESDATSPQVVVEAAAGAEREALRVLKVRGIEPDLQRVVYFGYSMGAAISLKLAVTAVAEGLPQPQALVLAAPGDAYHVARGAEAKSIWPDLHELRTTMPIAIVTGEDDTAIGLPTARHLAAELCSVIEPDRRVLLVLPSDEHDGVKVHAGHASPGAPDSRYDFDMKTPVGEIPKRIEGRKGFEESASLNQLDFFGYWRVLDEVIDSLAVAPSSSKNWIPPDLMFDSHRRGSQARKVAMGTWPDGTAYKAARIEEPCRPLVR